MNTCKPSDKKGVNKKLFSVFLTKAYVGGIQKIDLNKIILILLNTKKHILNIWVENNHNFMLKKLFCIDVCINFID